MNYYGYNFPFLGGQQNVLSKQAGDRIVKNDLQQLLLTGIGERIMRPNWGTPIIDSLFGTITDAMVEELRSKVYSAIMTYENRVRANVKIDRDDDNNQLIITVSGFYTDEENKSFEIELNFPLGDANGA